MSLAIYVMSDEKGAWADVVDSSTEEVVETTGVCLDRDEAEFKAEWLRRELEKEGRGEIWEMGFGR